jgi:hypothetical protein
MKRNCQGLHKGLRKGFADGGVFNSALYDLMRPMELGTPQAPQALAPQAPQAQEAPVQEAPFAATDNAGGQTLSPRGPTQTAVRGIRRMAIPGGWTPPRTAGHGPGDPGADERGRRAATAGSSGGNYNLNTAMNPRPDFTDHSAGAPGAWASMSRLFNKMYTDPPSIIGLARGGMVQDAARGAQETTRGARGGIVRGPGGPRDDKVPLEIAGVPVKLSNQEAVLPARTVDALGGPEAVERLIERTNGRPPERRGLRAGGRYMSGFVGDEAAKNAMELLRQQAAQRAARGPNFTIETPEAAEARVNPGKAQTQTSSTPNTGGAQPASNTPKSRLSQGWSNFRKYMGTPTQSNWDAAKNIVGKLNKAVGTVTMHPFAQQAQMVAGMAAPIIKGGKDLGNTWGDFSMGGTDLPRALASTGEVASNVSGAGLLANMKANGLLSGAAKLATMYGLDVFDPENARPMTNIANKLGFDTALSLQDEAIAAREARDNEWATGSTDAKGQPIKPGQPGKPGQPPRLSDAKPGEVAPTISPGQARNQALQTQNTQAIEGLEQVGINPEMGDAALNRTGNFQNFDTFNDATRYGAPPDPRDPQGLRTPLPDGWGVITRAPDGRGLRKATLYAPETYTGRDGLKTRNWEDTPQYARAIADNERNKGLLREFEEARYRRDLNHPRALIRNEAEKGLNDAYRNKALATGAALKQQELVVEREKAQAVGQAQIAKQRQEWAEKAGKTFDEAIKRYTTREDEKGKPVEDPQEAQEMRNFLAMNYDAPNVRTPQEMEAWLAPRVQAWQFYKNFRNLVRGRNGLQKFANSLTNRNPHVNGYLPGGAEERDANLLDMIDVGPVDAVTGRRMVSIGGLDVEYDKLVQNPDGSVNSNFVALLNHILSGGKARDWVPSTQAPYIPGS